MGIICTTWGFPGGRRRKAAEIGAYPQIPSANRAEMEGIYGYAPIRRTGFAGMHYRPGASGRDLRVCTHLRTNHAGMHDEPTSIGGFRGCAPTRLVNATGGRRSGGSDSLEKVLFHLMRLQGDLLGPMTKRRCGARRRRTGPEYGGAKSPSAMASSLMGSGLPTR